MSELPLHRHYLHYSELPASQRVLYTAALLVLGIGYLFALLNVYFTYAGRAGGNPMMLSSDDLIVAYSGSGKGSRLESALRGPMATMLPADERNVVLTWAAEGAPRPAYDTAVAPLLEKRCLTCHDGSNPHLPNLSSFDNLKKVTEKDTGTAIATLIRVSHIHLFGISFIFFLVGLMFSHAYVRPVVVQMPRRGDAVRRHHGGRELVVPDQGLPPLRLCRDPGRHGAGGLLRLHVADQPVSDVVLDTGRGARPHRAVGATGLNRGRAAMRAAKSSTAGHDVYSAQVAGSVGPLVSSMMKRIIWRSSQP